MQPITNLSEGTGYAGAYQHIYLISNWNQVRYVSYNQCLNSWLCNSTSISMEGDVHLTRSFLVWFVQFTPFPFFVTGSIHWNSSPAQKRDFWKMLTVFAKGQVSRLLSSAPTGRFPTKLVGFKFLRESFWPLSNLEDCRVYGTDNRRSFPPWDVSPDCSA